MKSFEKELLKIKRQAAIECMKEDRKDKEKNIEMKAKMETFINNNKENNNE